MKNLKDRLNDLQNKIKKCDIELMNKNLVNFAIECIERDRCAMKQEFNKLAGIKIY